MEKENLRSTLPAQPADPARRLSSEDEIDLVELFYVLWGHVWQIALCLILGATLAFGYTYFLAEPQYKATSSIYIVSASNNSVVNLTDLQIGAQLTADYQELLLSRPLLEDVIQNHPRPLSKPEAMGRGAAFPYALLKNLKRLEEPHRHDAGADARTDLFRPAGPGNRPSA